MPRPRKQVNYAQLNDLDFGSQYSGDEGQEPEKSASEDEEDDFKLDDDHDSGDVPFDFYSLARDELVKKKGRRSSRSTSKKSKKSKNRESSDEDDASDPTDNKKESVKAPQQSAPSKKRKASTNIVDDTNADDKTKKNQSKNEPPAKKPRLSIKKKDKINNESIDNVSSSKNVHINKKQSQSEKDDKKELNNQRGGTSKMKIDKKKEDYIEPTASTLDCGVVTQKNSSDSDLSTKNVRSDENENELDLFNDVQTEAPSPNKTKELKLPNKTTSSLSTPAANTSKSVSPSKRIGGLLHKRQNVTPTKVSENNVPATKSLTAAPSAEKTTNGPTTASIATKTSVNTTPVRRRVGLSRTGKGAAPLHPKKTAS